MIFPPYGSRLKCVAGKKSLTKRSSVFSLTLGPSPVGRGKHDSPFPLWEKGWDEGNDGFISRFGNFVRGALATGKGRIELAHQ